MKLKRLRTVLSSAALAAVAVPGVQIATAESASAVDGCGSNVQLRGDTWVHDSYWVEPLTGDRIDMRKTATLGYWYCPNGDRPNKIKEKWIDWCWTMPNNQNHTIFDGVTYNAYSWDDKGINVNPSSFKVGDDGTRQHCREQNIAADKEAWMVLNNGPQWKVNYTINRDMAVDLDGSFKLSNGSTVKSIVPSNDPALGDWFS